MVAPLSRFTKRAYIGTLVPVNAQAPLILQGLRSTVRHTVQSIIVD